MNYNHERNARKEIISLFRADLYFQLIQYDKYLVTISFQKAHKLLVSRQRQDELEDKTAGSQKQSPAAFGNPPAMVTSN